MAQRGRWQIKNYVSPVNTVFTETIFPDKWHPRTEVPQASWAKRLTDNKFLSTVDPPAFTNVFPDVIPVMSNETSVITFRRTTQYQQTTFVSSESRKQLVDKWEPTYPDYIVRAKEQRYTYPNSFFEKDTAVPVIFIDKYQPSYPDKIFESRKQQYTYPTAFFQISTFSETIYSDKWTPTYPAQIWSVPRLQYLHPSLTMTLTTIIPPPPVTFIYNEKYQLHMHLFSDVYLRL